MFMSSISPSRMNEWEMNDTWLYFTKLDFFSINSREYNLLFIYVLPIEAGTFEAFLFHVFCYFVHLIGFLSF